MGHRCRDSPQEEEKPLPCPGNQTPSLVLSGLQMCGHLGCPRADPAHNQLGRCGVRWGGPSLPFVH